MCSVEMGQGFWMGERKEGGRSVVVMIVVEVVVYIPRLIDLTITVYDVTRAFNIV